MLSVSDSPARASLAPERKRYARIPEVLPIPDLIELQLDSFDWFIDQGLRELFDEICPIQDFTGRVMELRFGEYEFGEPKYTELECRARDLTFAGRSTWTSSCIIKETGEIKEQRVFMGDFPLMTDKGTFIINGAERVVVSQLVRSPGVYFTRDEDPTTGRKLLRAKVIPNRGAWLEFETTAKKNVLTRVKVDRKRKLEVTKLLRAVGYEANEAMLELFRRVDVGEPGQIAATLDKDTTTTRTRGADRGLQEAAPGRPADRRQRREARREPLLQLPPLRPGPRRPLQAQQEARRRRRPHGHRAAAHRADHHQRGHRGHRRPPDRAQQRARPGRRHRPPGQPPRPRRRRAHPERRSASACCAWSASSRSA